MIRDEILKTIQGHLAGICRLTYPFVLFYMFLSIFVTGNSSPVSLLLVNLFMILFESMLLPVVIVFLSLSRYGQPINSREIYYEGIAHLPYVLMVNLVGMLPSLALISAMNKMNILLMMFLSGASLYLYVKLSFSSFLITLEENKPVDAIRHSFQYTVSYGWEIVKNSIRFLIPLVVLKMLVTVNFSGLTGFSIFTMLGACIDYLLSIITCIVLFEIYLNSYKKRNILGRTA